MEYDRFDVTCDRCGHQYVVDVPRCDHQEEHIREIACPICEPGAMKTEETDTIN